MTSEFIVFGGAEGGEALLSKLEVFFSLKFWVSIKNNYCLVNLKGHNDSTSVVIYMKTCITWEWCGDQPDIPHPSKNYN